jgi:protoheme IX farnesyltransferase
MPPVLGWAAVANDVAPEALLLFLIALRGRRRISGRWRSTGRRTRKGRLPMRRSRTARCTRGCRSCCTRWRWSPRRCCRSDGGALYLVAALALGGAFLVYAIRLYYRYSDHLARRSVTRLSISPRCSRHC